MSIWLYRILLRRGKEELVQCLNFHFRNWSYVSYATDTYYCSLKTKSLFSSLKSGRKTKVLAHTSLSFREGCGTNDNSSPHHRQAQTC